MNTTTHTSELENRLLQAPAPEGLTRWFNFNDVSYLALCGVSPAEIPELIQIALRWADDDWFDNTDDAEDEKLQMLPVTAWRALAELRAPEVAAPLLGMLGELIDKEDDWHCDEFPHVVACVGETLISQLVDFAEDDSNPVEARATVIAGLTNIGKSEVVPCSEVARSRIEDYLSGLMQHAADHPQPVTTGENPDELEFVRFNSTVLMGLLDLKVISAARHIEKAFSNNQIDVGIAGDWSDIQRAFGVTSSLGLPMPDDPINCMERFRRQMGYGIFSDRPLTQGGEPDHEASLEYCENAARAFDRSPEGKEVESRFGGIHWIHLFLEMGVDYLGVIVDTMSAGDAEEIVFEIIPRKVSTTSDAAEAIVFELRKFWEFVSRQYGLKNAASMVKLFDKKASANLRRELSDSRNFGMAKSMFMAGHEAGFDMTTEPGIAEFMVRYNASIESGHRSARGESSPRGFSDGPGFAPGSPFPNMKQKQKPPEPHMNPDEFRAFDKKRKKELAKKMSKKKRR